MRFQWHVPDLGRVPWRCSRIPAARGEGSPMAVEGSCSTPEEEGKATCCWRCGLQSKAQRQVLFPFLGDFWSVEGEREQQAQISYSFSIMMLVGTSSSGTAGAVASAATKPCCKSPPCRTVVINPSYLQPWPCGCNLNVLLWQRVMKSEVELCIPCAYSPPGTSTEMGLCTLGWGARKRWGSRGMFRHSLGGNFKEMSVFRR